MSVKSDQEIGRLIREYKQLPMRNNKEVHAAVDWMIANGLMREDPEGVIMTDDGMVFGVRMLKEAGEIIVH